MHLLLECPTAGNLGLVVEHMSSVVIRNFETENRFRSGFHLSREASLEVYMMTVLTKRIWSANNIL